MRVAIPEWLSLRVSGHVSRNRVSSRMLLRVSHVWSRVSICGDNDDHDDVITTRALLKADVCDRAFVVHLCDLYFPRCAVGVEL